MIHYVQIWNEPTFGFWLFYLSEFYYTFTFQMYFHIKINRRIILASFSSGKLSDFAHVSSKYRFRWNKKKTISDAKIVLFDISLFENFISPTSVKRDACEKCVLFYIEHTHTCTLTHICDSIVCKSREKNK